MEDKKRRITTKAGDKFVLMVTCDLSELTPEQVEEYAFDAIWIKEQATLRDTSTKAMEDMEGVYTFTAEAKTGKKRGPVDPVKAITKALPTMTKEQKDELIKLLNKA